MGAYSQPRSESILDGYDIMAKNLNPYAEYEQDFYFWKLTVEFWTPSELVVDLLEADDIWVLQFSQVFDVCLLLLAHLLDGHLLRAELAQEDSALCPAAQPLQLRNLFKWDFPHVCKQVKYILSK